MATNQDGFCGNCGNPRVQNGIVCPYCAQPYESTTGIPSGSFSRVTQGTPPPGVSTFSEGMAGVAPPPVRNSGMFTSPQVSNTPIPPVTPPQPLLPGPQKPRNTAVIVLSILVGILFLSTIGLAAVVFGQKNAPNQTTSTPSSTPIVQAPTATTVANVATNTPVPTATSTPMSALPCNVDVGTWANGSADWKPSNGVLLNDGSNSFYFGGPPTIVAPCQLGATNNYAVQTTIQVISINRGAACFGITVRGSTPSNGWQGYVAAVEGGGGCHTLYGALDDVSISAGSPSPQTVPFNPGTAVHTYRVEANGNVIKFLVDGAELISLTDNSYLSGMQVGLWCGGVELQVTSFQVTAL